MPEPESRRTALLKLKMDMVYRGLDRTKAEERFNQNVLPPPQEEEKASVSVTAPPPEPTK
jgi:hypothetical protein